MTDTLTMDARVEAGAWAALNVLEKMAEKAFHAAMVNNDFAENTAILSGSEVSLLFTDDGHVQAINRDHRGFDKPTNVLSFPQQEPDSVVFGPYLGDLVLAYETVMRESALENKPFDHHLQHLLVHGFLHLVGYDHENDDDAERMEALETAVLADLGIADPYAPIPQTAT